MGCFSFVSSGSGDRTSSWSPVTHYIPCIWSGCVRGGPPTTDPVFFLRKCLNYVSFWNHVFTENGRLRWQLFSFSSLNIVHFRPDTWFLMKPVQCLSSCWLTTNDCFWVAALGFFFFLPFVLSSLTMVCLCFKLTDFFISYCLFTLKSE